MTPRARSYDESDVRIRPNRRGSRPRTKDRPAHEDAILGFVTGVDRGRYTLIVHGEVRVSEGRLVGVDLPKLLAKHRKTARRFHDGYKK